MERFINYSEVHVWRGVLVGGLPEWAGDCPYRQQLIPGKDGRDLLYMRAIGRCIYEKVCPTQYLEDGLVFFLSASVYNTTALVEKQEFVYNTPIPNERR